MKLSRTHIALLLGLALAVITINAAQRVRYFGEQERKRREETRDGASDAQGALGAPTARGEDAGADR